MHVFTFGYGQTHPKTGAKLEHRFVEIEADTPEAARAEMVRRFGAKWSMQYRDRHDAEVVKYELLELTGDDAFGVAQPLTEGPEIKIGPLDGRERLYKTEHHIDELKSLARWIVSDKLGPQPAVAATNFRIWYDQQHDFHHLEFDLEGDHYDIRYYKVFAITKNKNTEFLAEKLFNYVTSRVSDFFHRGKHREWVVQDRRGS